MRLATSGTRAAARSARRDSGRSRVVFRRVPSCNAPGAMPASAQPQHIERSLGVLVDCVEHEAAAIAATAPVGTNEKPGPDCAPRSAGHADDQAREVPGLLVTTRTAQPVVVSDLVRMGRLPGGDVRTVALGVGPLPGCGPAFLALLAGRLAPGYRPSVGAEVLERLVLPAGVATISKNQLVCSRFVGVQFSVSRRGLRSKMRLSEPPGTRTQNRLIKSQLLCQLS